MNEQILKIIGRISPHASQYVEQLSSTSKVEILYSDLIKTRENVFLIVRDDNCTIFYASCSDENECILNKIEDYTNEVIRNLKENHELCFNVSGNNDLIISLVRSLGFKVDMEGDHYEYMGSIPDICKSDLVSKKYHPNMIDDFASLFDDAYYQLNLENNWPTDNYTKYKEYFNKDLVSLSDADNFGAFWLDDNLVGAYLFENNYIIDLVVNPKFQNHGYGQYILKKCLRKMMEREIKHIRLRVAKTNRVKSLYERNDFLKIACFSEHTYRK